MCDELERKIKEDENDKKLVLELNSLKTSFAYQGAEYNVNDFVYVNPQ